jgi:hypothetical protein
MYSYSTAEFQNVITVSIAPYFEILDNTILEAIYSPMPCSTDILLYRRENHI